MQHEFAQQAYLVQCQLTSQDWPLYEEEAACYAPQRGQSLPLPQLLLGSCQSSSEAQHVAKQQGKIFSFARLP